MLAAEASRCSGALTARVLWLWRRTHPSPTVARLWIAAPDHSVVLAPVQVPKLF